MNLDNLNLVELNAQEDKEINGGSLLGLLIFATICIIAYCFASDGNDRTETYIDGVRVGN